MDATAWQEILAWASSDPLWMVAAAVLAALVSAVALVRLLARQAAGEFVSRAPAPAETTLSLLKSPQG